MEENIDSIKESRIKKEESLKNASTIGNVEKNNPIDDNMNSIKNEEEVNKQNSNNQIPNENNNKKVIASNQNDLDKSNINDKSESSNAPNIKPKKEAPIEKKPFNEFVNDHLLPSLKEEFKKRGFEVEEINLKNTSRPIAGDKCWVIFCEIKNICNFWLSFEKEDISSLKSISLCKSDQKPSVIESFLIDEKRITLKLIISRILQRLNGQKLIGIN